MNGSKGFTLIEILIVIVILGITVGFALISYGDFGESRRRMFSFEQLVNTIKLAQQRAILESSTLGLRIDNSGYQILKFQQTSNWTPISDKGIFRAYYFPRNTLVVMTTNNKPPPGTPTIVINSSGDMTPFTLRFGIDKDNLEGTITGKHDGSLDLSTVKPK